MQENVKAGSAPRPMARGRAWCTPVLLAMAALPCFGQSLTKYPNPEIAMPPPGETAASDFFGLNVALAGSFAAVGAHNDVGPTTLVQGTVHVLALQAGQWLPEATLTGSDTRAVDEFGFPLVLSGNSLLVGARFADVSTNDDRGAAYVFVRTGNSWAQQAKLLASDGAANDLFGVSLAIDGNVAAVGAMNANIAANADQGAVYLFTRSGSTWTPGPKLVAPDGAATDLFGTSAALSGATLVVGARQDDVGAAVDQGSVYVFVNSIGTWTFHQRLSASDGVAGDLFGSSVALSGDVLVVGARLADVGGAVDRGAAYVYRRSGGTYVFEARLGAASSLAGDRFGHSVSIDGDQISVSAVGADIGGRVDQGAAYRFRHGPGGWTEGAVLVASDGDAGDSFGSGVATSGDWVMIGSAADDAPGLVNAGSVYFGLSTGHRDGFEASGN